MEKRKLRYYLKKLRVVPHWWFFVAGIVLLFVAVFGLRANNQKMIELREAVYVADEQDGDVEAALKDLREHVYSHMNTNLTAGNNAIHPPIQLKYRYERLVASEQAKQSGNDELYSEAQDYCEARFPGGFSGRNRLPCIQEYLDQNGAASSDDVSIPDSLYKFDFVSPSWSFDLAGWSIILSVLSFLIFAGRLGIEFVIKRQLR